MNTHPTDPLHPTEQGYVPVDEWPELTRMVEGFGDPSLPPSSLDGRDLSIRFENGWTISHAFADGQITWTIVEGDGLGETGTHSYRAVEVRPEIVGEPAEGYEVRSVTVEPQSVEVSGARTALEALGGRIATDAVEVQGRTGRFESSVSLRPPEGVAPSDINTVTVTVDIGPVDEPSG